MTTNKTLCIYHSNCADGFGAAWVVRKALGAENVEFHAGVYGREPPDVTDRNVIIVDFSYKRSVLEEMASRAKTILILDHHKTAAEDLDNILRAPRWSIWKGICDDDIIMSPSVRMTSIFDMERSGAGIAWDYFFSDQPRPVLIDHIEDRDLWLFRLEGTREIQACLFSFSYDFDVWDHLMRGTDIDFMRAEGVAIERKHHKDIGELVAVTKRRMIIGGHNVPVANLPYTLTSDAGNLMAEGERFAGCYWDTPGGRVFSLRSREEGADVSLIAKGYGGGGHIHAARFHMPRGWEGDRAIVAGTPEIPHDKEWFLTGMVKELRRRGYRSDDDARTYASDLYHRTVDRGEIGEADLLAGDPVKFVAADVASWSA